MIRYTISLLLLVVVSVIVQQFIPSLTGLNGSRLLLVALVFLCASVTVPVPVMLLLAFVCGFLTDARHALDVIHRVTRQCQEIGDLFRPGSE